MTEWVKRQCDEPSCCRVFDAFSPFHRFCSTACRIKRQNTIKSRGYRVYLLLDELRAQPRDSKIRSTARGVKPRAFKPGLLGDALRLIDEGRTEDRKIREAVIALRDAARAAE